MGRSRIIRSWLVGLTKTRTRFERFVNSRATCQPIKPVAPVTSVVMTAQNSHSRTYLDWRAATSGVSNCLPICDSPPKRQTAHTQREPYNPDSEGRDRDRIFPKGFFQSDP